MDQSPAPRLNAVAIGADGRRAPLTLPAIDVAFSIVRGLEVSILGLIEILLGSRRGVRR